MSNYPELTQEVYDSIGFLNVAMAIDFTFKSLRPDLVEGDYTPMEVVALALNAQGLRSQGFADEDNDLRRFMKTYGRKAVIARLEHLTHPYTLKAGDPPELEITMYEPDDEQRLMAMFNHVNGGPLTGACYPEVQEDDNGNPIAVTCMKDGNSCWTMTREEIVFRYVAMKNGL